MIAGFLCLSTFSGFLCSYVFLNNWSQDWRANNLYFNPYHNTAILNNNYHCFLGLAQVFFSNCKDQEPQTKTNNLSFHYQAKQSISWSIIQKYWSLLWQRKPWLQNTKQITVQNLYRNKQIQNRETNKYGDVVLLGHHILTQTLPIHENQQDK